MLESFFKRRHQNGWTLIILVRWDNESVFSHEWNALKKAQTRRLNCCSPKPASATSCVLLKSQISWYVLRTCSSSSSCSLNCWMLVSVFCLTFQSFKKKKYRISPSEQLIFVKALCTNIAFKRWLCVWFKTFVYLTQVGNSFRHSIFRPKTKSLRCASLLRASHQFYNNLPLNELLWLQWKTLTLVLLHSSASFDIPVETNSCLSTCWIKW